MTRQSLDSRTKNVINELIERFFGDRDIKGALSCGAAVLLVEAADYFAESGAMHDERKIVSEASAHLSKLIHAAQPFNPFDMLVETDANQMVVPMLKLFHKHAEGFMALDDAEHDPTNELYTLGVIDHTYHSDLEAYSIFAGNAADAVSKFRIIYPDDAAFQVMYVAPGELSVNEFDETHSAETIEPVCDSGFAPS